MLIDEAIAEEEKVILLRLKTKLVALPEKGFPYQESFRLTYQFLHYKSFLDYQKTKILMNFSDYKFNIWSEQQRLRKDADFHSKLDVDVIHHYAPYCSLALIEQLPWPCLFQDHEKFNRQLEFLYYSRVINIKDLPALKALSSEHLLVPCTNELDIDDLNLIFFRPIWLVGVTTSTWIKADGLDMCPATFFEHDLLHLIVKLLKLLNQLNESECNAEVIETQVRQFYENIKKVKGVKIPAVELVIAFILHEHDRIFDFSCWQEKLKDIETGKQRVTFKDLPIRFTNINNIDLRNAAKWLSQNIIQQLQPNCKVELFQPVNDELRFDFNQVRVANEQNSMILQLISLVESNLIPLERESIDTSQLWCFLNQCKNIKNNVDLLKEIFKIAGSTYFIEACWLIIYLENPTPQIQSLLSASKVLKTAQESANTILERYLATQQGMLELVHIKQPNTHRISAQEKRLNITYNYVLTHTTPCSLLTSSQLTILENQILLTLPPKISECIKMQSQINGTNYLRKYLVARVQPFSLFKARKFTRRNELPQKLKENVKLIFELWEHLELLKHHGFNPELIISTLTEELNNHPFNFQSEIQKRISKSQHKKENIWVHQYLQLRDEGKMQGVSCIDICHKANAVLKSSEQQQLQAS
ncbi:hypothetical protein [Parashewanella curva]|uniref:hypothetical protein n=1 Tax=Parashewanella curva TaxID=2338552 RepID=UPI0014045683|nr:hypothetical protein [Parashewanella curva]